MTGALEVVRECIGVYARQATANGWNGAYDDAMACFDLEQEIDLGVRLFEALKDASLRVQDAIARKHLIYTPDITRSFAEVFKQWLAPCEHLERRIRTFESHGFDVRGADRFRACCREVRRQDFDVDGMFAALEEIRAGHGLTLHEAADVLRRRVEANL